MSSAAVAQGIGRPYPEAIEALKQVFPKRAVVTHAVKGTEADNAVIRDAGQIHVLYDSVTNIVRRVQA